jgi:shikimate dehydrogenase
MTALVVLIGHEIGYAASPAIHRAAFGALGIDARYELADVAPEQLPEAVAGLRGADRLGANVTRPYKLTVRELVDRLAPEVEQVGAANTIVRDRQRLVAHNTDLPAIAAELAGLGRFRSPVILGAGGAARAAKAALAHAAARVRLIDRAGWSGLADALENGDLLVNATPIGTESEESPVPAALLRADLAVLDLVYRPTPTALVRAARRVGAPACSGAGVLLRQAAASFELWTGCPAPIDPMRDALRAELGPDTDA